MIKTENTDDGRIRHYSDAGVMIRQVETGELYEDAVDYIPCRFTYEETDVPIETELTPEQALNILLGGSENEESESNQI